MFESSLEINRDFFYYIVRKAYSSIESYEQEHDFEKIVTDKYLDDLLKRNGTIKVLTMAEPRPIETLYVRANILKDKITAEQGDTAEELEELFNRDNRDFGVPRETVDGELIVNKLQNFIVLGKPGAGKTTYLRYLTLMMLNVFSQIQARKLPVFITLREFADTRLGLMDFIIKQFESCGFQNTNLFIERLLDAGDCIILFDGLDEVSQQANQSGINRWIKDFCDKYNKNQFVISCRVAAYNRWFDKFHDVEMADFNEKQKGQFIQNWFYGEPKIAKHCWANLRESPQLNEMASVPLLLTLLCIAYNRRKSFPTNRAELYEEAIDALLRDWDASREVKRDEIYKYLSLKYKKSMFARIAWGTFRENMYFIPERTLTKQIEQYIKNLPSFKSEELEPESQIVLKAIEAQHGIFVERAKKVHSFAHLTFQEYFTAKYIVDNAFIFDQDGKNSLMHLVGNYFYEDKWLEVFILTSEMLDNADELLLLMLKKNHNLLLEIPELESLISAAQAVINSEENKFSRSGKEVFAIFIALDLAIEVEKELENALTIALNHTYGIAIELARVDINDRSLPLEMARGLARGLIRDRTALESYRGQIKKLGSQTLEKTIAYLKGNYWITKCLNSGAYVTQSVRNKVLTNISLLSNLE